MSFLIKFCNKRILKILYYVFWGRMVFQESPTNETELTSSSAYDEEPVTNGDGKL